jgi:hypothetical protein
VAQYCGTMDPQPHESHVKMQTKTTPKKPLYARLRTLTCFGSRHTLASRASPLATQRACRKSMYDRAIATKSSKLSTCSSHGANSFFCNSTAAVAN